MGTVSYPQPAVSAAIEAFCIPLKLDITVPAAEPIVRRYHQVWTPDLRILDSTGDELYRWNGYLPPFEFAPQVLCAVGQANFRFKRFDAAIELYTDVLTRFPTSLFAPEAQYYLACSRYRKSHESGDLLKGWHELEKTYPSSEWTVKQNF